MKGKCSQIPDYRNCEVPRLQVFMKQFLNAGEDARNERFYPGLQFARETVRVPERRYPDHQPAC